MELGLSGKTALVTGSNRGTGEIIALHLEREGCRVIRHCNQQSDFEIMQNTHPQSIHVWGDITHDQGAQQCLEQIRAQCTQVDILINNYGTATGGKWEIFKEEDWLDLYQKNVLSAARMIAGITPHMKTLGWGRIIQISTLGSLSPNSRMPHYYASKGAMANMSVSLAKELKHTGITVNTISPGLILTEELKMAYQIKAQRKGWGENWSDIEAAIIEHEFPNLCGRIATREEVADLVCFLASDKAGYINAQNLRLDGGSIALTI